MGIIYGLSKYFGIGTNKEDPCKPKGKEQKTELVPRTQGSYLETLTEEERKGLHDTLVSTRGNYSRIMSLVERNYYKNPKDMRKQQEELADALVIYIHGGGITTMARVIGGKKPKNKIKGMLQLLGFTKEESILDATDLEEFVKMF